MTWLDHPGSSGPRRSHGRRPTLNIGPWATVKVGNQLHSGMTKSPGSQSISMSTVAHQARLHPVGVSSQFQGDWESGDDILMLRSGSCYVSPKVKNLRSARSTTKPRRSQSPKSKCWPTGDPGRTRRCSENDDECIVLTYENWHFT